MKWQILISVVLLLLFGFISIPSVSIASDNNSGQLAHNSAMQSATGNNFDMQGYSSNEQVYTAFPDGSCSNQKRRFHEGLSYTGNCDSLVRGSICLTYSDGYKWVVYDYRIDCDPLLVGYSNCKPIELIRCYYADYYHILGTSLIMSIPRPEKFFIRSVPLPCMQTQNNPIL